MTNRWWRIVTAVSLVATVFALGTATVPVQANQITSKVTLDRAKVGDDSVTEEVLDIMYDALSAGTEAAFVGTVGGLVISTGAGAILGGLGGLAGGLLWGAFTHFAGELPAELTGPTVRSKMPALAFD